MRSYNWLQKAIRRVFQIQEDEGLRAPGRKIEILPDDVFITSYPKSGNTWVRFLISNLVWSDKERTDFTNIHHRIPDIYFHSRNHIGKIPCPRYLKSHEPFDPLYPKTIYIVRDVRSVLISYYFFLMEAGYLSPMEPLQNFIKDFLEGSVPFGSWKEHVLSWTQALGDNTERFFMIRYEDLKESGRNLLRQIADFLSIDCTEEQIVSAVQSSSFYKMKKIEESTLSQGHLPVVRHGKSAGWECFLTESDIDYIWTETSDLMENLGYTK
jgi:hypothetical protein